MLRDRISMNDSWRFYEGEIDGVRMNPTLGQALFHFR